MDYVDYIKNWFAKRNLGSVHKVENPADELDLLKHYPGVEWQDVTNFPDLPAGLVPNLSDSAAYVLLGESIFKKSRVYAPKAVSGMNINENQALLQDLAAINPLVLQSTTGFSRWKKLSYVTVTAWANVLRTVKAPYGVGALVMAIWKVEYNQTGPPGGPGPLSLLPLIPNPNEITRTLLFAIDTVGGTLGPGPVNAGLIPFSDLVVWFDSGIDVPYYSEIYLWMAPAAGTWLDVFMGVEVR